MKRALPLLLLISLVAVVACGGSSPTSDRSTGGGSGSITASFDAEEPSPGNNEVSMAQAGTSGNAVTVVVQITNTNGVYGANFDVSYDTAKVQFEGHSPGTILESGGQNPTYQVHAANGMVTVGVSRTGAVPGVNVLGTQPLVLLTFRVTDVGTMPIDFLNGTVYDDQSTPQPLPISAWWAGSLVGVQN